MRGQALRACPLFLEAFSIHYSGLDPVAGMEQAPESRLSFWIPAFAGTTNLISANIYAAFRQIFLNSSDSSSFQGFER